MTYRFPLVVALLVSASVTMGACSPGTSDSDTSSGGGTTGGGAVDGGGTDGGFDAGTSPPDIIETPPEQDPQVDPDATSFFFSYDESASTAARDLSFAALDNGRRPDPSLGRPFEFLNAESFSRFDEQAVGDFGISMTLRAAGPGTIPLSGSVSDPLYALGVNVIGPTRTLAERRNVVLTILVDVSGSMNGQYANETRTDVVTLLDVVKYGLQRIGPSLKEGDVLNLVSFSANANVIVEGLDPIAGDFGTLVAGLTATGSTNIGLGVDVAYEVANRTFDEEKANRVLIITDAEVNTGELDPNEIAAPTVIGGLEGIYFSGIGVGSRFNDNVLNTATEAGKGSYSAMVTPNDAERLFTTDFLRFVSPAATDVRFQLTYPQSLDQLLSFSEDISENPEDVRTTNFAYNSEQFFVELFTGPDALMAEEEITLGITYTDSSGRDQAVSLTRTLAQLAANETDEVDAALAVTTLAELINGNLTCQTVQSSTLYQQPISNNVYALYRQYITRFCEL